MGLLDRRVMNKSIRYIALGYIPYIDKSLVEKDAIHS